MSSAKFSICNLLLSFSIISTIHSCIIVAAYNAEDIIGGIYARLSEFKYQAPILARNSSSNSPLLAGGGAYIHNNLVISAANCFLQSPDLLKDLTFSIAVDTIDLNAEILFEIEIEVIFTVNYYQEIWLNDIAVARLKKRLDLITSTRVIKLDIPPRGTSFEHSLATVSGFGSIDFQLRINPESGKRYRVNEIYDDRLKYVYVRIATDAHCQQSYPLVVTSMQICGVMLPVKPTEVSGLSMGDSGNPLVVGTKIVGIATKRRMDSNDLIGGCVYTRVSAYEYFIQGIKDGNRTNDTKIFWNTPHPYFVGS